MNNFKGFTDSETFTQLPDSLFHHLLNEIEDIAELKVTLYMLWRIAHIEGNFRALCETDFIPKDMELSANEVKQGLEKAIQRGTILRSAHEADVFYFVNSPRGRAAADAFAKGQWRESARIMSAPPVERPNVFKLYEENIGPLTPLIADMLKDAESLYYPEWIAEALIIAVKNNKRSWKYVEAILKRWKEEGRAKKQDRQDDKKSRQRNIEDKINKFVGH